MGLLPPIIYSGYNANNFNPVLTYIYDATINGYRAVTPEDLAGGGGQVGISGTVSVKPIAFTASGTFSRPQDNLVYAQYDAISNSTSAPTLVLASILNANSGDSIEIRNVRLNVSSKPTGTKLSANVFISPIVFSPTNDNAELSIDDSAAERGAWVQCSNQYQTALNYRCASDPTSMLMQLSSGGVAIGIQAGNAWNPNSGDAVSITIEGFLYPQ